MRILLINQAIPPYIIDGGVHIYDLAIGLTKKGYEVHLLLEKENVRRPVTLFEEYPWEGFVAHQIVPAIRGLDWISYIAIVGKYVKKLHRRYDFDIIHAHGPDAGFLLYYKPNSSIITTVHGIYTGEYNALKSEKQGTNLLTWIRMTFGARLFMELEKIACRKSDAVITVSPKDKLSIAKDYNIDPSKVHVVLNGVNVQHLRALASKHRSFISAERPFVLFVGRLAPGKGLLDLLYAWKILKKRIPCKGSLLIAGAGPLSDVVQSYARKKLNIIYLSHVPRSKLMKLYEEADIFVLPSLFEGLPYTLLEAVAFSKPLLISKYLMLQNILKDRARFIDPKNTWEFAVELKRLMENEDLRRDLSKKVNQSIPIFSLDNMVRSTVKIYHTVLQMKMSKK
ncbi:MAG: glycosyltransferase family 4 protein [Nitrososphaeria archaeon]